MRNRKMNTLNRRVTGFGCGLLSVVTLVGLGGCAPTGPVDTAPSHRVTAHDQDRRPATNPSTAQPFYDEMEEIVVIGERLSKPANDIPTIGISKKAADNPTPST